MIKNLKTNYLFYQIPFLIFFIKNKYDKEYLISVSNKEILKHEDNFYEKRVKEQN